MSRKYRQQGYQDDDRDREEPRRRQRPPSGPLTPEERAHKRGLRHALDRETREVVRCHVCGRNLDQLGPIARETSCPHCDAPLHCCRTCRHFDSSARWQCRADIAEAVTDKGKANDCAAYAPRLVLDATGRREAQKPRGKSNDPKSMFDDLFKR
jgi:hypothetical protein